jgi:raffinose/stachyose/melibiose transport system permease protein
MGDIMYKEKSKLKSLQVFAIFGLIPLLVFSIVVFIPFLAGLFLSLTNWNGSIGGSIQFIGIKNYISAVKDPLFWGSLGKTFYYVFFVMILTNTTAFLFGLLVTSGMKGQNFYRAGYFTPNLIGGVILGYTWQFIFSRVLVYLGTKTGIPAFEFSWLTDPHMALWALIIVGVWQNAGYMMLIYIAGFVGIDKSLIEAARMDGASPIQMLKNIKIPMMVPAFTITLFLTLRKAFMVYDVNLSLTKGGPYNTTELISMHVYNEAFLNQNMGQGQAKAFLLFLIVAAIAIAQVAALKKKEVDAI